MHNIGNIIYLNRCTNIFEKRNGMDILLIYPYQLPIAYYELTRSLSVFCKPPMPFFG